MPPSPSLMLLALSMPLRALARRCQSWRMRSRSAARPASKSKYSAVHEGHAQAFQLPRLQGAVAALEGAGGHEPGLEPGIALPFAALADQVVFQRVQAPGQRAGVAVRAQPQVGAEDLAVGVDLGQHRHHAARQAAIELMVADAARPVGLAFLAIEHDEVDIGRHVQLAAAQLAHAHDQHFLGQAGGRVARHAVHGGQFGRYAAVGFGHRQIGQRRHGAHHFLQRRLAAQVARDQRAENAFAQLAQHHAAGVDRQRRGVVHARQFIAPFGQPGRRDGRLAGRFQPGRQVRQGLKAAAQVAGPGQDGGEGGRWCHDEIGAD